MTVLAEVVPVSLELSSEEVELLPSLGSAGRGRNQRCSVPQESTQSPGGVHVEPDPRRARNRLLYQASYRYGQTFFCQPMKYCGKVVFSVVSVCHSVHMMHWISPHRHSSPWPWPPPLDMRIYCMETPPGPGPHLLRLETCSNLFT